MSMAVGMAGPGENAGHGGGHEGCTPPFGPHEPNGFHKEGPNDAHQRNVTVKFRIDPRSEGMEANEDG